MMFVAINYAVLIVAIAVTMFSGSNSLSSMLTVTAVRLGASYGVTCRWFRQDADSRADHETVTTTRDWFA
ncbi:hypothetical protein ASG69_14950 [Rhodococcus sp. Leaf225]|nr:hypothetical protein ASG69_14950 [Rhodococcus sp. Leaf225]KQU39776.1 hypothetical protein ASH03_19955 [Rhodococcus sp. Leaf258]